LGDGVSVHDDLLKRVSEATDQYVAALTAQTATMQAFDRQEHKASVLLRRYGVWDALTTTSNSILAVVKAMQAVIDNLERSKNVA
jgi:hypothetical protein